MIRRRTPSPRPRATDKAALHAPQLMALMWLASPALPVGGFSYSEGLEAAIETGLVQGEAAIAQWLTDQLALSQARADLAVLAKAMGAWRRHDAAHIHSLNDWVRLTRESSELRQQTEQMGRSMLEWLRQRHATEPDITTLAALQPAPTWPVAWALAPP